MSDGDCKHEPGLFMPRIDRARCEGKAACVAACPYGVFAMGIVPADERKRLGLRGWLKGYAHGWHQAFATRAEACHACGLCVSACPEQAITLVRR